MNAADAAITAGFAARRLLDQIATQVAHPDELATALERCTPGEPHRAFCRAIQKELERAAMIARNP